MVLHDDERGTDEREDRHMVHIHNFDNITFVAESHQHVVMGATGPARGRPGPSHFHRMRVRTSFHSENADGHWHWFDVMTGPAVYTADSEHIHVFQGPTSFDDNHAHDVLGATAQVPDIEGEEVVAPPPTGPQGKTRTAKR